VIARIRAVLRRTGARPAASPRRSFADVEVDEGAEATSVRFGAVASTLPGYLCRPPAPIPSCVAVTAKLLSNLTVTSDPSAFVMCASYAAPSASVSIR
jgi:hypothetical protein